jgi:uncharacterized protein YkwD
MPRIPLLALAAAVALIAAVSIITSPSPIAASAEVPPAPPLPDSPPSTAYVLAGAVEASALTEFEEELTEQARTRTTSTTTTTTTTVAAVEAVVEDAERSPAPESPSNTTTTSTTISTTTTTTEAPAVGSVDYAAESDFAGRINSVRSSNGKSSLTRDGSLDARARDWAKYMAESGSLAHSNLGSLIPPWTSVAENLGQGGSVSQVFDLLAGSSGHLSNMLGDFTHLGVGVWRDANGVIWTTHLFAR